MNLPTPITSGTPVQVVQRQLRDAGLPATNEHAWFCLLVGELRGPESAVEPWTFERRAVMA